MSLAETYSAATTSMVVSPATTPMSCIGPQLVGVIVPEKVPVPTALAEPANTVIMKTAPARAAMVRPGRKLTCPPRLVRSARGAHGKIGGQYTPIHAKCNLLHFQSEIGSVEAS